MKLVRTNPLNSPLRNVLWNHPQNAHRLRSIIDRAAARGSSGTLDDDRIVVESSNGDRFIVWIADGRVEESKAADRHPEKQLEMFVE